MKFISLFSGAGGLDLGFNQQGFEAIVAYDTKSSAVNTYNHNREKRVAKIADLAETTGDDIITEIASAASKEEIVGVVGGPPCQYFSNGNKSERDETDVRRHLPIKYASILKTLNKEYELDFFILENVDGLAKPAHLNDFNKILSFFRDAGFFVHWKILDAYDFGVAQIRKRVFIIGWNEKIYPDAESEFKFPEGDPSNLTIKDKIHGFAEPTFFKRGLDPKDFPLHVNHWTMQPRSPKFHNPLPDDVQKVTRSFRRLSWEKASYTVAYGHNEIHVHPDGHRRLSIYEAMLLQGFPKSYQLIGNLSEQVTLVSDAVPPPLAYSLALSIKNYMQDYGRIPKDR